MRNSDTVQVWRFDVSRRLSLLSAYEVNRAEGKNLRPAGLLDGFEPMTCGRLEEVDLAKVLSPDG